MATSTETNDSQPAAGSSGSSENSAGRIIRLLLLLLVVVGVIGAAAYGSTKLLGDWSEDPTAAMLTHRVEIGDLLVTVTEDGNVESAANVDIKCQVAGGSAILSIVADGEQVEEGELLVELDQAALDDQIGGQKIVYERARSSVIQAEKDYSVAKISVEEYTEGNYKIELQAAGSQITIAEENLRTSQNALDHSERMFRRGYISNLELEGQQFSVQRATLDLDSANTAREVLEKYTKVKMMEDLSSQVETANAHMQAEKAAFQLEESKLRRLEDQLKHCVIHAPQAGMVVYANASSSSRFGSSQGPAIEEGAQVRERQSILKLPDLSRMQVKVNVHETKVEDLTRDMRARVKIQDLELQGSVVAIANQPEASSRFMGNVKEYATTVRIDNSEEHALKPGMTAEVEILVAHLKDILTVPVAAIVEQRGEFSCWVKVGQTTQKRTVTLGMSNDQFVALEDGLAEGDLVLLNPRAFVADARGGDEGPEDVNVNERFGESKDGDQASKKGETKGRKGGGREGGGRGGAGRGGREGGGAGREGGGGRGGAGREGGGGGRRGGGGGGTDWMQYDTDGDGQIGKAEAPAPMQRFFDRVDSNSDGALDASEIAAMRNRPRGGGGGGGEGGGGGREGGGGGRGGGGRSFDMMQYDTDGDGKVSKDEAPERMRSFFDRMDPNSDGFIDSSEIEAMRNRSRGGGGGGGGDGGGGGGPR